MTYRIGQSPESIAAERFYGVPQDHAALLDGPDPRHTPGICLSCRIIDEYRGKVEA